ncbi:TAXI family TRAP transporter solute-binding subunit [Paracoccus sp. 1_MG-2023]|uniref:TAXI family TRAP transporter solute-binding subunit n=1 Tax=unclassified Paracoccus (in: a-proteobacteria) TaxID=2688777 RepID=UPI001C09E40B|nr:MULTISPECIES: TAXI family TRAP transporter solute-binding subunit [unclassified Paracoccus (in: a-proteobacteria)]MBU2958970.1 TAXI family TRAP transporter solute-binding subunit [Paracoccus sp. C2R09]MDO6670369.1 TAXI family TRAP transporter solute-binding subunit [Paracoccus sp. 1_MG-2023]
MNNLTHVAAALAVALLAAAPVAAQELRIGTASIGGAFFPVGQTISNLVNEYTDGGFSIVPVVTQGSVQNPRLVADGEVDLGITSADLAADAVAGAGAYQGVEMQLAALGPLHPSVLHMVVTADSDIRTFDDLRGKRVAVGPAGGGTLGFLNQIMPIHDMTMEDIIPSFLSYGDGFSQLSDGNVDAALALSGYPAAAVMQAAASGDLRIVDFTPERLEQILQQNPAYTTFDIPSEVYDMDQDSIVIGVTNMLVVRSDMDEGQVRQIVSAIYDHLDEFAAENANGAQIDKDRATQLAIPLHPAAAAYFGQ